VKEKHFTQQVCVCAAHANLLCAKSSAETGIKMIQNEELPIGFTMALAQHSDALNHFSHLSQEQQDRVVEGAKKVESKQEMRSYVENMFHNDFH